MELAWLCVVAGEAGSEGLRALIDLLGKTESDDVTESAIPALTRHVVVAYEDIKKAIDAGILEQRRSLYECLRGIVVFGDADKKDDLAEYARGRVRREVERGVRDREWISPLRLLVDVGAHDAGQLLAKVPAKARSKASTIELEALDSYLLGGSEGSVEVLRKSHEGGWRHTAENLRKLFHPTEEEIRGLQQLLVSLGDSGRGVH